MTGEPYSIRYLTRADVVQAADRLDPVAIVRAALALHADGKTTLPNEAYLTWHNSAGAFSRSLALPGALWGIEPSVGLKIINSSLSNEGRGMPRAQGLTMLFDRETAYPLAIMEAAYLSSLRTSAYTALSTELLGPAKPTKVAVVGCGALGEGHVRILARRLPGAWFALFDVSVARRDALIARLSREGLDCRSADSAEQAVRDSGIVITATTTTTGYIPFDWLAPGSLVAHVSLDDVLPDVVAEADLVVIDDWQLVSGDDRRLLGRMYRDGTLLGPGAETFAEPRETARKIDGTLSDIVVGRHPGRTAPEQIILSNPFGMGILDVAVAAQVLRVAQDLRLGLELPA